MPKLACKLETFENANPTWGVKVGELGQKFLSFAVRGA
jgi:hypothetical protein